MKKLLSLLLTAVMLCSMLAVFAVPVMAVEDLIVSDNTEITENADRSLIKIAKGAVLTVKNGVSLNARNILNYGTLIIEADSAVTIQNMLTNAVGSKTIIEPNAKVKSLNISNSTDTYLEIGGEMRIGNEYHYPTLSFDGDISIKDSGMIEVIIPDAQIRRKNAQFFEKFCFTMTNNAITAYGIHNIENGLCIRCGKHGCDVTNGSHIFQNGKCTACGYICQNNFHNGVCPECGMRANAVLGSVFSGGSLAVIFGIAAAVIFGAGGFLLGRRKKKPVAVNTAAEENFNEEE